MTKRILHSRLLTTTAALTVALAGLPPLPLVAQEAPLPPVEDAAPVDPSGTEAERPAEEPGAEPVSPEPEAAAPSAEDPAEPEPDQPPAPAQEAPPPAAETAPEAAPATEAPPASEAPTDEAPEAPPSATEAPPATETPAERAPAAGGVETPPASETAPAEAEVPPEQASEAPPAAPQEAAPVPEAAAQEDAAPAEETTTEITADDARSSDEDFATTASGERRGNDDGGLSNLEKVGLLALGGLAIGALMNNGDEVVSNTGDRVVVRQNDGSFAVLKDDDALLRQPGSTVRTERFDDGSTRSTVEQGDGTRVVTIRDASGRVLRRSRVDAAGNEVRLIDDTVQAAPVDVSVLPPAREEARVSATDRGSLRDALARIEARENARTYSLAQIRDYRQVRALAPVLDVDNITFRTGSAAVDAGQAEQLADLGRLVRDMVADNPREVFLVEGHTDAVGSAASNLALSDRRAESVALALTEYFDVPPENLVVQGYGESDLRVETETDEPRNRRVAVRIITPILQTAAR
ncbi:OmpA family protein [Cereibacter sp. SYSU M97828]|nr:OmpA family protein [Cereibacter flavus]